MTTRSDAAGGLLIVDKPSGWTSHDVVGRLRRLAGTRKVGHAGTLDPMATGVLVVGIDRGTKLLTFLVGCDKDYAATIRLGQATLTDDREGELTASVKATGVTDDEIAAAVHALTGDIEQVPSAVSAIKVNGERAYARVRAGEEVALAARPVTVSQFTIDAIHRAPHEAPECLDVDVRVTVSSGTYVRALARDLGAALGWGATSPPCAAPASEGMPWGRPTPLTTSPRSPRRAGRFLSSPWARRPGPLSRPGS
jgi:tRNA pseudouridine synthase B (EC 4.2.1.70)